MHLKLRQRQRQGKNHLLLLSSRPMLLVAILQKLLQYGTRKLGTIVASAAAVVLQVLYRWSDSDSRGQLLREEIYRPHDTPAATSTAATASGPDATAPSSNRRGGQGLQQQQQQQVVANDVRDNRKALVISTYSADSGELLLRSKQRCVMGKATFRVRCRGRHLCAGDLKVDLP